jgi:hypothetical protein
MNYKLRKLVMIASAFSFVAGSTTQATGFDSTSSTSLSGAALMHNARLSIRRAADFGTDIYLSLFIDGIHVATLGPNEGYEATVRPGRHVLSASTTPNPYGNTVFSSSDVTMKGGQSYSFTAVWGETDRATLDNSNAAVVRLIRNISHYN